MRQLHDFVSRYPSYDKDSVYAQSVIGRVAGLVIFIQETHLLAERKASDDRCSS